MNRNDRYLKIVDQYSEPLYWHIRRLVISHEDAQDILQDTLVSIFRNIWQLRDEGRTKAWVYRIATNKVNRYFLREKRRIGTVEIGSALAQTLESSEYVNYNETAGLKLQKAVMTLSPQQQTVFNLRYYDELDYNEISRITGSSVGSLKVAYHNAREKIQKYLENE